MAEAETKRQIKIKTGVIKRCVVGAVAMVRVCRVP